MDDKELPEWYQVAKGFFREIEVFSMSMYSEMNGSGILAQIRYAAIRESRPTKDALDLPSAVVNHCVPVNGVHAPFCTGHESANQ